MPGSATRSSFVRTRSSGCPAWSRRPASAAVSIVNTLGSGVLENPALLPFLPRLAEHLLGEPLLLPSVPTWWCGEEEGRRHVLAHLDRLVIKPIARRAGPSTVFPWELSHDRRDELRLPDRSATRRLGRSRDRRAGVGADAHRDWS